MLSTVVGFVLALSRRLWRPVLSPSDELVESVAEYWVLGRTKPPGDSREAEADLEMTEAEGVGEAGWDGGKGRIEASSSAPLQRCEESSANDILGRVEASERNDGDRDRLRKDMD